MRTWKLLVVIVACGLFALDTHAAMILTSIGTSDGASSITTTVNIDGSGNASASPDYTTSGSIAASGAFGTSFDFTLDAASGVNTTAGPNFGSETSDGTIDRDAGGPGRLGVEQGANNGINIGEGYLLGIDATGLSSTLAWHVTGVQILFAGTNEDYNIVNRNNTSLSFTGTADGMVDVSGLGLIVQGGLSDIEFASVFATGADSNWRITGFELDVISVPEPTTATLTAGLMLLFGLFARMRRRKR